MNNTRPPAETPIDDADALQATEARDAAGDEAEAALQAAQDEVLRVRADMDNLRKRLAREMDQARRFAGERILGDLLPVVDSLEQGLAGIAEQDPAREGLALTLRQLLSALERHGVVPVDPAGQAFDPAEHQAISTQPAPGQPENSVIAVLQKGWRLHDRLLRPALVIVSASAGDA